LPRRALSQQSKDQFAEYPTSRQVSLLGRQFAKSKERFEAFERVGDILPINITPPK